MSNEDLDVLLPDDLDDIVDADVPPLGIDLGTTLSCAAIYNKGRCKIVENKAGHHLTPSLIYYRPDNGEVCLGQAASDASLIRPQNFLFDMKRLIGRQFNDPYVQQLIQSKRFNFKVVQSEQGKAAIEFLNDGKIVQKSPEQVSSEILKYIRESACEKYEPVAEAVITVPANFNEAQRKATKAAGELAGFKVLRLVSEPVAAALYYVKETRKVDANGKCNLDGKLMVFDFGGGTLDVSIIELQNNKFEVQCVAGDTFLGGRNFDEALFDHFKTYIIQKFGENVITPLLLHRLKRRCEKLKCYLSEYTQYELVPLDLPGGNIYSITLTREMFEDLTKDLLDRAMHFVTRCLEDAKLNADDMSRVILVGGSTLIPKIRKELTSFFGQNIVQMDAHPDESVALGAAILATSLKGRLAGLEVIEVIPFSIGIRVGTKLMSRIIKKNTRLPVEEYDEYCTVYNDQETCTIDVFAGERKNCDFNILLGTFKIINLPPGKAGSVDIKIIFRLNEDGILEVTAEEKSIGIGNKLIVNIEQPQQNHIQSISSDAESNIKNDEILEKFHYYQLNSYKYVNHIKYKLDEVDCSIKQRYVLIQLDKYVEVTQDMSFMDIDKLKAGNLRNP